MIVDELGRIPMSPNLAATLGRASEYARAQQHLEVTLEHLLLALTEDADATAVLAASKIDGARLNADVSSYLGRIEERMTPDRPANLVVSLDLRRILEAAAAAARQGRRREINGAIVLAAMVGDGRSAAAHMLRAQGLTFEEAIRALQRVGGMPAPPPSSPSAVRERAHGPAVLSQPGARSVGGGRVPGMATADDILAGARERVQTRAMPGFAGHPSEAPRTDEAGTIADLPPVADSVHGPGAAMSEQPGSLAMDEPTVPATPQLGPAPQAARLPRARRPHSIDNRSPEATPHQAESAQSTWLPPQQVPSAGVAASHPALAGSVPHAPEGLSRLPLPPTVPPPLPRGAPSGPPAPPPVPGGSQPYRQAPASPPWPHSEETRNPLQRAPAPHPQPAGGALRESRPARTAPPPQGEPRRRAPGVEIGQLIHNVPRVMRVAVPVIVEARIAKADVRALAEGLQGGAAAYRHEIIVTKAMSVKLRAPDGGFWIETASPETQWIENNLGLMTDNFASWRWSVTPRARGHRRLQIIVSARTVGGDGLAAETALPDQVIEVSVRTNYRLALRQLAGWAIAAVIGGLLAKFGEGFWALGFSALSGLTSG